MTAPIDQARALVGQQRTYTAPEPLGPAAGRYFGLAIGDDNPLYSDPEFARQHGLPGVTAPLTLICETNQYAALPIAEDGYAGHQWDIQLPNTRLVRGGNSYVFHRRLRPDDVVTATWSIAGVEAKPSRSGSDMIIVTSRAVYTNQHGDQLAENEETIIYVPLGGQS